MNYVSETVRDAAVGVAIADEPASLETFLKPGCAAAIWRRQMPTPRQQWFIGRAEPIVPIHRRTAKVGPVIPLL